MKTPPYHHDKLALELARQIEKTYQSVPILPRVQRIAKIQVMLVDAFKKIEEGYLS